IGITITKSRMLTNCTAATSRTTARSRCSGVRIAPLGCRSVGRDSQSITGDDGSDVEPADERHVIGFAPERAGPVAESARPLEVEPLETAAGEEVVEVHSQVHEAGGRERA